MRCPFCQHEDTQVKDSRPSEDGAAIRRRRQCLSCARRYTTYERLEEPVLKIIKKDGTREPFDPEKIRRGLEKACWKRPVSADQISQVVATIESDIYNNFESEVDSRYVGELLMRHLRELDQVAFVRFASVYREFKDVRDFVEELEPMLEESKRTGR